MLLNSDFNTSAARSFADRILTTFPHDPLLAAIPLAFTRRAEPDEISLLNNFLATQQARYAAAGQTADAALVDLCHMLLSANEFVYVD
jgi:hypothetical protein